MEEEAIVGQTTAENPTEGNTFIIWKDGEVDDFELKLSYRIKGGNSGIQYRSKRSEGWVVGGYQADIDSADTYSGILYEERGHAQIMAERGQRVVFDKAGKKRRSSSLATKQRPAKGNQERGLERLPRRSPRATTSSTTSTAS